MIISARALQFSAEVVTTGLSRLAALGGPAASQGARNFLLTVALQESGLTSRCQLGGGPARGFWQFEQGGVTGVLTHAASAPIAKRLCDALFVEPRAADVWRALEGHDILACGIARLLLFTDPAALPSNREDAWSCYLRLWRPGKPRPDDWADNWGSAVA